MASDDAKTRETTAQELLKREDLFRPLHEGLKHRDAEVRRAVQTILDEQKRSLKQKVIPNIPKLAKNGDVERYVERMVSLGADVPEEAWAAGLDLARDLWRRGTDDSKKNLAFPDPPFLSYKLHVSDVARKDRNLATRLRIAADRVDTADPIIDSFVVSRGPVCASDIAKSVVFTNGNIIGAAKGGTIYRSIVCCDGDIDVTFAGDSVLIASGSIRVQPADCVVIQNAKSPFGFLKRFALGQLIEVKAANDAIEVTDLKNGSCFAEAGLKKGDQILVLQRPGE